MLANKLRAGALPVVISITNQNIYSASSSSSPSTAGYTLNADGLVYKIEEATSAQVEQWVAPAARAIDYEAKVTMISGALTSGTVGSWLPLSTTRTWTRVAARFAYQTCTFTVEIRRAGVGTILDSATVILAADAT